MTHIVIDGCPVGWHLEASSYGFHRSFHATVGRPAKFGEFTRLRRQIQRKEAIPLANRVWEAITDTGETVRLMVHRYADPTVPHLVFPADWSRPQEAALPPPVLVAAPPHAPITSGRLSLGNEALEADLRARLQRTGITF